jgi:perosamine synthetase
MIDALAKEGIDTRPFFIPIHKLPPYRQKLYLPTTDYVASHFINLPTYTTLTDSEIDEICEIVLGTCIMQEDADD